MLKRTPLYAEHVALGAKLVDFAGWDMPIHYGSQLEEHHAVRSDVGMFDVAHMAAVDLHGARTREFLRRLLANDVARLTVPGKALYACMLNAEAGVIDDLIVYFIADGHFRLVVNAGTTDKDLAWLRPKAAEFGVEVCHRTDLGILAVQGSRARVKVASLLPTGMGEKLLEITPFNAIWVGEDFAARTGYTGEDGCELILPNEVIVEVWRRLLADGVRPCGLGARDTLRLEAGMNLYGQDMDENVSPLECGLAWTVAWEPRDRDFIGRAALEKQRAAPQRKMVSLVLDERGVLRAHQKIRSANGLFGETSSGGFAPTMKRSVAFARVPVGAAAPFEVEIRGQWLPVREVKAPFVRNGKVLV